MDDMSSIRGYGTAPRPRRIDVGPEYSMDGPEDYAVGPEAVVTVDPREDSIGSQLNRLGHMLDRNLKMLSVLEERLQPVLSSRLPSEEKESSEMRGYSTGFGELVGMAQERSRQFDRHLESMLKRIEL